MNQGSGLLGCEFLGNVAKAMIGKKLSHKDLITRISFMLGSKIVPI